MNTITKFVKRRSARLESVLVRALMTETPITRKRYVISFIGIGFVRYRMIPNIANNPNAKPIWSLTLSRRKQRRNVTVEMSM
jgi:hexokinase